MATISNTPRPAYAWDTTDNVWYPIGAGAHSHTDYLLSATAEAAYQTITIENNNTIMNIMGAY